MAINLTDIFEVQRKLDAEIERMHPSKPGEERIYKINLALLVELGELANEQRSWKFWSKDQEPRTKNPVYSDCLECDGLKYEPMFGFPCPACESTGKRVVGESNTVLEEYVDCLHFILSIGNFIEYADKEFPVGRLYREETIEEQFLLVFDYAVHMQHDDYYYDLVQSFLRLGEMLGFDWEQIETAYMKKNKTNWERQANGY